MKRILPLLLLTASLVACRKDNDPNTTKPSHPKADSLTKLLKKYTAAGVPGAVIAVKDASGFWAGAEGVANLRSATKMTTGHLQYGFSVTKMATAASIMQLQEKGLININLPVSTYLPAALQDLVPLTTTVTVKMLLNHTSGYEDYARLDEFTNRWMQNPLQPWTRAEYYDLMKRAVTTAFAPGTDFLYSNTNYYLLSVIIDNVTGSPHSLWFQQNIFNRLAMKQTFYKHSTGYPAYNLPDVYWPGFAGGSLESITEPQQAWAKSEEYGATGLIASLEDYIRLLEGLVNGELVSAASLNEMRTWVQGSASVEPDYGLGFCYWGFGGKPAYGHDGDGIGATIQLVYFPASKTYAVAAANASAEFGGEIAEVLQAFKKEVGDYLAGF